MVLWLLWQGARGDSGFARALRRELAIALATLLAGIAIAVVHWACNW